MAWPASAVATDYGGGTPRRGCGPRERFVYRYRDANERFRVRVDGRFRPNGVSGTFSVRRRPARAAAGG